MSVRFHAEFREDLRKQLDWLGEHEQSVWIVGLRAAIEEAIELVSRFPEVGTIEAKDRGSTLRRLILRKVPYVIWFARQGRARDADVWFLRLFHARQARPEPRSELRRRRVE